MSASLMGMAGGSINAIAMALKYKDNKTKGNVAASQLYGLSAFSFIGTAGTASADFLVFLAKTGVQRGVTSSTVVAVAGSLGARTVLLSAGGAALTVSGLGLILLGIGIIAQIGAVALTPSDVQAWVSRSYWGIDKDIFGMGIIGGGKRKDRFKTWEQELDALNAIMQPPKQ